MRTRSIGRTVHTVLSTVTTPSRLLPSDATPDRTRDALLRASLPLRPGELGVTVEIMRTLAADIVEGRLAGGQQLNSVALASRFEISRTPVREALIRLEGTGVVLISARRPPTVWQPALAEVQSNYEFRMHLARLQARLVVERATEAELNELVQWQTLREEDLARGDLEAYFWHNAAGQQAESHFAKNQDLHSLTVHQTLRSLVLRRMSVSGPQRAKESVALHRRLLEAYIAGKASQAEEAAVLTIQQGYRFLASTYCPVGQDVELAACGSSSVDR